MAQMTGLVLQRNVGEQVVIDLRAHGLGLIRFGVIDIRSDSKVRLMIDAPRNVPVHRLEVFNAIEAGDPPQESINA